MSKETMSLTNLTTTAKASLLIIVAFLLYTAMDVENASKVYGALNGWILKNMKWYYMVLVTAMFIFSMWLMMSRFGDIRLGADDDKPEYSTFTWLAMLFSAGIAIGLVFWGVAEPILHYDSNPLVPADATVAEKQQTAIRITFFHWGISAWATYAFVGLCLCYVTYRKGMPLRISSILYSLMGKEKALGTAGTVIDTLVIFGAIFGIATSLGLGVQQLATGIKTLAGIEFFGLSESYYLLIFGLITLTAISAYTGINKGIRILSEWNMFASFSIMTFLLVFGPTAKLLDAYVQNVGDYIAHLPSMTLWSSAYIDSQWQGWWTTFYWAWWLAWAPFVGIFMARVSRGRTIREFMMGILILCSLYTFLWLSTLGSSALFMVAESDVLLQATKANSTTAIYVFFENLDTYGIVKSLLAIIATLFIATGFVTSADSGTIVINTLASGGETESSRGSRVVWAYMQGAIASVLLYMGGLKALQTASIVASLPLAIIFGIMLVAMYKALKQDA